jgi:ribonuclease HI
VLLIAGKRRKTLHGGEALTTNNRMELTAAIEALKALQGSREVLLYTDSKYLMDGIEQWLPAWKERGWKTAAKKPVKNQDLWQELERLREKHQVRWKWVKAHNGNVGNEEADALANRGIDEQL